MMYSEPQCPAAYRQTCWLPLDRISPRASLHYAHEQDASLQELTDSIRWQGLQRPLLVRRQGNGRYIVVAGNRRLMACRLLGMTHVDAVILPEQPGGQSVPQLLDALISHRLHYLEEAEVLCELNEHHGISRQELARMLGTTAQAVTQRMQLTALGEELRACLLEEGLPERVALALLRLTDETARLSIARRSAREHLDIREVELLVSAAKKRCVPAAPPREHGSGRVISLVRDPRLYVNAIRSITGQMQEAGVEATLTERRVGSRMELTVSLPARRRRTERRQSM